MTMVDIPVTSSLGGSYFILRRSSVFFTFDDFVPFQCHFRVGVEWCFWTVAIDAI